MRLAIRVLQCYVPKARPYARAFLTPVSSKSYGLNGDAEFAGYHVGESLKLFAADLFETLFGGLAVDAVEHSPRAGVCGGRLRAALPVRPGSVVDAHAVVEAACLHGLNDAIAAELAEVVDGAVDGERRRRRASRARIVASTALSSFTILLSTRLRASTTSGAAAEPNCSGRLSSPQDRIGRALQWCRR